MLNLWNRVAQTRSCKCSSCIHSATKALSRRATTTKQAPRLLMTCEGFVTFCSSATLASAAILDLAYKHKRRTDWDKAIRKAKGSELEVPGESRIPKGNSIQYQEAEDLESRGKRKNSQGKGLPGWGQAIREAKGLDEEVADESRSAEGEIIEGQRAQSLGNDEKRKIRRVQSLPGLDRAPREATKPVREVAREKYAIRNQKIQHLRTNLGWESFPVSDQIIEEPRGLEQEARPLKQDVNEHEAVGHRTEEAKEKVRPHAQRPDIPLRAVDTHGYVFTDDAELSNPDPEIRRSPRSWSPKHPWSIGTVQTSRPKWNGKEWTFPPMAYEVAKKQLLERVEHFAENPVSNFEWIHKPGEHPISKRTVVSEKTGISLEHVQRYEERNPKTYLHLKREEDLVERLTSNLLKATASILPQMRNENELHANLRAELAAKVQGLSTADMRLPSYGPLVAAVREAEVRALNSAIISTFNTPKLAIDLMVAKICYDLLTWSTHPNVRTYEILILRFTKLGLGKLSQIVVDGFLHDSILRPDEKTVAALLQHYIARKDEKGFSGLIQKMRGTEGSGMRIRRRKIDDLYEPAVARWALSSKVIHRGSYVHEKAHRDQTVFELLVVGTLMFTKIDRAIVYARAMVREGFRLTIHLLQALVGTVISRNKLREARALLYLIVREWNSGEASNGNHRELDLSADSRLLIHQLASFCGVKFCNAATSTWDIIKITDDLGLAMVKQATHTAIRRTSRGQRTRHEQAPRYSKEDLIQLETTVLYEGLQRMAVGLALDSIKGDLVSLERTMPSLLECIECKAPDKGSKLPLLKRLENACLFLRLRDNEDKKNRELQVLMHKDAKALRVRGYREAMITEEREKRTQNRWLWWQENTRKGARACWIVPKTQVQSKSCYLLPSGRYVELERTKGFQTWTEHQVESISHKYDQDNYYENGVSLDEKRGDMHLAQKHVPERSEKSFPLSCDESRVKNTASLEHDSLTPYPAPAKAKQKAFDEMRAKDTATSLTPYSAPAIAKQKAFDEMRAKDSAPLESSYFFSNSIPVTLEENEFFQQSFPQPKIAKAAAG